MKNSSQRQFIKYGLPSFGLLLGLTAFTWIWGPRPYRLPQPRFFPLLPTNHNPPSIQGVELGRFLFYDPILSRDSTISCAHCHQQNAAFSNAPLAFSVGINGDRLERNTLALFNLAWHREFFWDGRASGLEQQILEPVRSHQEMDLDWPEAAHRIAAHEHYPRLFRKAFGPLPVDSTIVARAIAQFLQTLISYNSKFDSVLRGEARFTPLELQGFVIMNEQNKADCLHCHPTDADALTQIPDFINIGLDPDSLVKDPGRFAVTGIPADKGAFKVPSLRNLKYTAPYMHDGRFATLEEVLDFYSTGVHAGELTDPRMQRAHKGGVGLSGEQKKQILAFLNTLNDSVFVSNPEFGDPHKP